MILSDKTIEKLLAEGSLAIEPLEPEQIQPASVDIRLGDTFGIVEDTPSGIVGLEDEIAYKTIRTDRYILLPGQFVLATTMEYVRLGADLTAFVEGRSSLGRMGLFVQNAGWVDPGFEGEITLELFNANRCALELRSGSWCSPSWTRRRRTPTPASTRASAALRARACTSIRRQRASAGAPCRSPRASAVAVPIRPRFRSASARRGCSTIFPVWRT